MRGLQKRGFEVNIFYLWVADEELTLARIKERVSLGGHDVPKNVVERRFGRSISNFLGPYRQLADHWILFDNSGAVPREIATSRQRKLHVLNERLQNEIIAT